MDEKQKSELGDMLKRALNASGKFQQGLKAFHDNEFESAEQFLDEGLRRLGSSAADFLAKMAQARDLLETEPGR
jgi:hypothetical protein